MKVVAHYKGKVIKFNNPPTPSYVTLTDVDTGTVTSTDAISEKLLEYGISNDNDEFEITITESIDNKISAIIQKINLIQLDFNI